jgi:hypothetical protein
MRGGYQHAANALGISVDEYRRRRDDGEKWCTWCKDWHPIGVFGSDRSRADGLQTRCRDAARAVCRAQRARRGVRQRLPMALPDPDAVDHDCARWAARDGDGWRCLFSGCRAVW